MKKIHFALIFLVLILGFASADYSLNSLPRKPLPPVTVDTPDEFPDLTRGLLENHPPALGYQIVRRVRTTQLFEKIDLTSLQNLRIYRNQLEKTAPEDETKTPAPRPIIVYEIQGPLGQGGITYLNLKLKFKEQSDATMALNEMNDYGDSSFYFNDLNHPETTFLVVQWGDHAFGFEFSKKYPEDFELIKGLLKAVSPLS